MKSVDKKERKQIQEDWKSNMSAIKVRLEEIKNTIKKSHTI